MSTEVTVVPQFLEGAGEKALSFFGGLYVTSLRATIVWGFLAIFFPQLGATWILVAAALIALANARPVNQQVWVGLVKKVANS